MYKEYFPERLKKARNDAGYTQREVAEIIKIQQSKIAKLESGNQEPDLETLGKLAEFYAVTTDWLLGIGAKGPSKQTKQ